MPTVPRTTPTEPERKGPLEKVSEAYEKTKETVMGKLHEYQVSFATMTAAQVSDHLLADTASGMRIMLINMGYRLGLLEALNQQDNQGNMRWLSAHELANRTNVDYRYVRQWLEAMVANSVLLHREDTTRREMLFQMPPTTAHVLADPSHQNYMRPLVTFIPTFINVFDDLEKAARQGGYVKNDQLSKEYFDSLGQLGKARFTNLFVSKWLPNVTGVVDNMKVGAKVLLIGEGVSHGAIELIKNFPKCHVVCIDRVEGCIGKAQEEVKVGKYERNVEFIRGTLKVLEVNKYLNQFDFIGLFGSLHHLPYPVDSLQDIKKMLNTNGVLLVAEPRVSDHFFNNTDTIGTFQQSMSFFHCLPHLLGHENSYGIPIIGPDRLDEFANKAGFRKVERVSITDDFWRFYRIQL